MVNQRYLGSDPEDINDVLLTIEKSFNINFETNELEYIRTFGELCEHIISKFKQQDTDDCTTQQAFYKLREAIATIKQLDKSTIHTNSHLASIFPRQNRKKQIAAIENTIGFKLNALRPKLFISWILAIITIGSLIEIFIDPKFGLIGFISSVLLLRLSSITGKEFKENTIGELSDRMSQENYLQSRRNSETVNKKEIVKKIEQLFIVNLGLGSDFKEIPPETIIVVPK